MNSSGAEVAQEELLLALLGPRAAGGPRRGAKQLLRSGREQLRTLIAQLPYEQRIEADATVETLTSSGIRALLCDDQRYPDRLRRFTGAPIALFYRGPIEMLENPTVGVCGSRNATSAGLRAARACGQDAARLGVTVVSGYARGIDTESHLACLEAGGSTIAVLAEGILNFRLRPAYRELPSSALDHLLVISQFPPSQHWTAGAAMTRNQVVIGLSQAVVVVEAGETGGTLRAGEVAVQSGRRLLVMDFAEGTPQGNAKLIATGARRIINRVDLAEEMRSLRLNQDTQLTLE
ncbi:DNA-processing protein DprA [Amycolatopsis sp. EV170708-02-1]|uniref:DNA-processing protein DprA n=1 Tax=Amycolatopsis sp. EV170708-02-1 TaxID=2919322 RepID=UPI001F0B828A|nr:DNA-processing protein DprA [Amycolatopsis sp. EV170708-02-1]UMP01276.1 DNA-protecting protein DprA [Amycolatopsis sp. EV170708-02-1]